MADESVQQTASLVNPLTFIARIVGINLFGPAASPPPPPPPSIEDVTPVFLRGRNITSGDERVDRQLEEELEQALALRFLRLQERPAAQLTREPVPVPPLVPPGPVPTPAPIAAPEASQEARERSEVPIQPDTTDTTDLEEFLRMAFGFSDITGALGELSGLVSGVGNLLGRSTQAAPVGAFVAGPAVRAIGGAVGGGAIGAGITSFFGGNGNGTALQRIKSDAGRSVSRSQVIRMARVCGLDVTASTLNTSVSNVCEVVSKGMPRRGRGISSRDMSRTRSTLGKLNTMQRSLSSLCPPARRRSPTRRK